MNSSEYSVGNFYQGYMDMTYFTLATQPLKENKLKVVILLNHEELSLEIYLVGQNKQILEKYWKLFKSNNHPVPKKVTNYILMEILDKQPDFNDANKVIAIAEDGVKNFFTKIDKVLS